MSGVEIGLAAGILSAVSGAAGTLMQAQAAASQAEAQRTSDLYNASVADRNKAITLQNKKTVLLNSQLDVEDQRRKNKRQLASIAAAFGNSGVEMVGTPLDALAFSAAEMEVDAQRIDYQGQSDARELELQARGLGDQAAMHRVSAESARQRGRSALRSGYLSAGMSLIGGGASAYADYSAASAYADYSAATG
jgi:hypothetical protein